MNTAELKLQLFTQCMDFVNQRIDFAKQAMDGAQESANQEEKSSAGDKYETGRAMAQLERDKAAAQVSEARKMLSVLDQIKPSTTNYRVGLGSLVITDLNKFYLSISAGKLIVDHEIHLAISAQSPIGLLLIGKQKGEQFSFNNQRQTIVSVL
jgi:transcription elongation GreA/GreB family factor